VERLEAPEVRRARPSLPHERVDPSSRVPAGLPDDAGDVRARASSRGVPAPLEVRSVYGDGGRRTRRLREPAGLHERVPGSLRLVSIRSSNGGEQPGAASASRDASPAVTPQSRRPLTPPGSDPRAPTYSPPRPSRPPMVAVNPCAAAFAKCPVLRRLRELDLVPDGGLCHTGAGRQGRCRAPLENRASRARHARRWRRWRR